MSGLLLLPEIEAQLARISELHDVEALEQIGVSICTRSQYEPLIEIACGDDDDRAGAALTALFYSAGAIGIGKRIGPRRVADPPTSRVAIGGPILALSVARCAT